MIKRALDILDQQIVDYNGKISLTGKLYVTDDGYEVESMAGGIKTTVFFHASSIYRVYFVAGSKPVITQKYVVERGTNND